MFRIMVSRSLRFAAPNFHHTCVLGMCRKRNYAPPNRSAKIVRELLDFRQQLPFAKSDGTHFACAERCTPPPGRMPSSTAARVACIASSTRSSCRDQRQQATSGGNFSPCRTSGAGVLPGPSSPIVPRPSFRRQGARTARACLGTTFRINRPSKALAMAWQGSWEILILAPHRLLANSCFGRQAGLLLARSISAGTIKAIHVLDGLQTRNARRERFS
jgi:hypothetical protein